MKSKKCSKCGEVKTVDCFSKDKAKKDGFQIVKSDKRQSKEPILAGLY